MHAYSKIKMNLGLFDSDIASKIIIFFSFTLEQPPLNDQLLLLLLLFCRSRLALGTLSRLVLVGC